MNGLDELAAAIADAQDRRLADGRSRRLLGVREAVLADPRIDGAARPAWLTAAVALAVVAVLVVGAGLWLRAPERAALTFTVGDESVARVEALWIAAPEAPVEVGFSDGSRLVLDRGSRARVDTASASGRVVLESGAVEIRAHASDEDMRVDAGPFALALTDAACEIAWDGGAQRLGVVVQSGRVHVSGPGEQAHELVAGQRIEISTDARPPAVAALAPPSPAPTPVMPSAAPVAEPSTPVRASVRKRVAPAEDAPDWSTLARASKHREAFAAAEAIGFARLCDTLDADALLQLADVARFAGKSTRAGEALTALRRRHPGTDASAVAAYTLGRLAAGGGRHAEAALQFGAYLRERPKGSLAREALGRMLEAEAAAGSDERADATARRYLELYPSGPHADLAAARSR